MITVYDYTAVEKAIREHLLPTGYEVHVVPGVLLDSYVCIAPDDQHYHFCCREVAMNEWSSALTVQRYRRLPKWAKDALAAESAD